MRFKPARWLHSLALRILLAYVAGALLSISLLILLGNIVKDRLPGMAMPDRTLEFAQLLQFDSSGRPSSFLAQGTHSLWIYDSLREETAYRVLDESGAVVLLSPGAQHWPAGGSIDVLERGRFYITLNGEPYDGATEWIEHDGRRWFVQLTASSRMIDFLHQEFAIPFIRLGVIALGALLLVVFTVCAYVSLKYSLRPLRRTSRSAAAISSRSLNERLQTAQVPLEIVPLINSFNAALDQIEKGFRIQQEFLAKAAHELKTPLTLIRAEIDLMQRGDDIREPLLANIEHLTRHVHQLLLLAEASEPLSYQFTAVDVGNVARDSLAFLEKIALEAKVTLTMTCSPLPCIWLADQGALFTLLKNLLENAIQHAPQKTEVHIAVGQEQIRIRDWGPGVELRQLPLLFSRFWRGSHRRDIGAGLGLAICQEICDAHGWTLSASNAHPGLMMTLSSQRV